MQRNAFFGAVTAAIVATMMLPEAFGAQRFTQWGGMYVDGWCYVTVAPAPSDDPERPATETEVIGEDDVNVWFTPMHNDDSCAARARSFCSTASSSGWTIAAAYPYMRGAYLLDKRDVCSLVEPPWSTWFRR